MKKMIRGHSHTPAIKKGTYQMGTVTPVSFGYNKTWTAGQQVRSEDLAAMYAVHYGAHIKELNIEPPPTRRREAIEHTRRKLGL